MSKPDLKGFYYFYVRKCKMPQRDCLFYGLARLAKDYPDADPHKTIVTHFSHWIHRYLRYLEDMNQTGISIPKWEGEDDEDKSPEEYNKDSFVLPPVWTHEEQVKEYMIDVLGIDPDEDDEDEEDYGI